MKLKFVVPDVKKTFGNITFAGAGQETTQRVNGGMKVLARRYCFYSDIQKADNLEVVIPGKAGVKHFEYEQSIRLINPRISVTGYAISGRGYASYVLNADDIEAVE